MLDALKLRLRAIRSIELSSIIRICSVMALYRKLHDFSETIEDANGFNKAVAGILFDDMPGYLIFACATDGFLFLFVFVFCSVAPTVALMGTCSKI